MREARILYPVFALAAWTFIILLRLAFVRLRSGLRPDDFKLGESSRVPEKVAVANRNYMNLLELPILFYVACTLLYVGPAVSAISLWLAWIYVALRIVHSLVHLGYNHVMHRLALFAISNFILIGLWLSLWRQLGVAMPE